MSTSGDANDPGALDNQPSAREAELMHWLARVTEQRNEAYDELAKLRVAPTVAQPAAEQQAPVGGERAWEILYPDGSRALCYPMQCNLPEGWSVTKLYAPPPAQPASIEPAGEAKFLVRYRPTGEYWRRPGLGLSPDVADAHPYTREQVVGITGDDPPPDCEYLAPSAAPPAAAPDTEADLMEALAFCDKSTTLSIGHYEKAMLDTLAAAYRASERDAGRWRFFRSIAVLPWDEQPQILKETDPNSAEELDALIDAAINSAKGGKP